MQPLIIPLQRVVELPAYLQNKGHANVFLRKIVFCPKSDVRRNAFFLSIPLQVRSDTAEKLRKASFLFSVFAMFCYTNQDKLQWISIL